MILRVGVNGMAPTICNRSGHLYLAIWRSSSSAVTSSRVSAAPVAQLYAQAGALAELRVGIGHDGAGLDGVELKNVRLDIDRIVFDAATIDHLLDPAGQGQEAVGIEHGQVAGAEPAVIGEGSVGLRLIVQVAGKDGRSAHLQFALFARTESLAVAVDRAQFRGLRRTACRIEAGRAWIIGTAERAGLQLAHAPKLDHRTAAHEVVDLSGERRRHGGAGETGETGGCHMFRLDQTSGAERCEMGRRRKDAIGAATQSAPAGTAGGRKPASMPGLHHSPGRDA